MIKQMFKLIWNRKKSNFLMMMGIFISFFVLFMVMVTINYNLDNFTKPLGFNYKQVWKIRVDWKNMPGTEVKEKLHQVEYVLESFPEIESFAHNDGMLFMPGTSSSRTFKYKNTQLVCETPEGGDDLPHVLDFKLVSGRWFDGSDNVAIHEPAVINKYVKEKLFPNENPIGKIIKTESRNEEDIREYIIVGLIDEFRFGGEFTGSDPIVFHRLSLEEKRASRFVNHGFGFNSILVRVKPQTTMATEALVLKQLNSVAKGMTIKIDNLEELRKFANKSSLTLPIVLAIICGFLIINVALGLFGIIWYHTNQRRPEIGLRRATGATVKHIYMQIVGEAIVLSTFGILFGSFFALQFPALGLISFIESHVYYFSYFASVIIIYLISILCSLYPGRIASKIQPAIALHYE